MESHSDGRNNSSGIPLPLCQVSTRIRFPLLDTDTVAAVNTSHNHDWQSRAAKQNQSRTQKEHFQSCLHALYACDDVIMRYVLQSRQSDYVCGVDYEPIPKMPRFRGHCRLAQPILHHTYVCPTSDWNSLPTIISSTASENRKSSRDGESKNSRFLKGAAIGV